jgi:hypothetical protein
MLSATSKKFDTFTEAVLAWRDIPEVHTEIFKAFYDNVQNDPELKYHRDIVEQWEFGYGERSFQWLWNLVAQELPHGFRFLEIGVYQGQVLSLMSLLNKRYEKHGLIVGLTPLEPADDAFSKHHDVDYEERIKILYGINRLDAADLLLIVGYSDREREIELARKEGPYHCIYIDGNHNYDVVVKDIKNYGPMVAPRGLLVMDDSANYLDIPDGLISSNWKGIIDVSNAVRDTLENDLQFEHIFSVGHIRVWRKK